MVDTIEVASGLNPTSGAPGSSSDDFIRAGLPSERLWVGVVVFDVSVDGSLQIDDSDKGAAFEARCIHWPITLPSSTSRAAKSVVVP